MYTVQYTMKAVSRGVLLATYIGYFLFSDSGENECPELFKVEESIENPPVNTM